jgi:hypothetical protein
MAEINSQQVAKTITIPVVKLNPTEKHGRVRQMFAKLPATYAALNIADTVYLGNIPGNARIVGAKVSNATGTASSTLGVGLRSLSGTVIAALGLFSAVDIATAGDKTVALNGTLVANGADYTTPAGAESQVYATIAGAATGANQSISVTIFYVTD